MKHTLIPIIAGSIIALTSCKKEKPEVTPEPEPVSPSYTVPATYDFGANANYDVATKHINMTKELVGYLRSTHNSTAQVTITSSKLKNMFMNTASTFTDQSLNSAGFNLRDKTSDSFGARTSMDGYFDEAAATSQATVAGSDGVAGKVLGPANSSGVQSAYLLNAKGFEYKELVEKGIMGALMYSEAMSLLNNLENLDNTSVTAGMGTSMEHAWDLAFGYFGVPAAFPTTTTGLSYWGNYCNSVNAAIGSNAAIMNAFLKGRAAITAKDVPAYTEARNTVVAVWEKVVAAKMINYLKGAKNNFASDGPRSHNLSEAAGFIKSFRYNPRKKITDAQITQLETLLGDNLYKATTGNIDQMISSLSSIFSLDSTKL